MANIYKLGFIILSIIGVLRIPEDFYLYKDNDGGGGFFFHIFYNEVAFLFVSVFLCCHVNVCVYVGGFMQLTYLLFLTTDNSHF
jgi:hypothetical protein